MLHGIRSKCTNAHDAFFFTRPFYAPIMQFLEHECAEGLTLAWCEFVQLAHAALLHGLPKDA